MVISNPADEADVFLLRFYYGEAQLRNMVTRAIGLRLVFPSVNLNCICARYAADLCLKPEQFGFSMMINFLGLSYNSGGFRQGAGAAQPHW
jgi:hypothetical protein